MTLTLYLSPSQLAAVRGVTVQSVWESIRNGTIPFQMTNEGIKIKISYTF